MSLTRLAGACSPSGFFAYSTRPASISRRSAETAPAGGGPRPKPAAGATVKGTNKRTIRPTTRRAVTREYTAPMKAQVYWTSQGFLAAEGMARSPGGEEAAGEG